MVINGSIICSHSTNTLPVPADASHNAESESVVLQLGDGMVADETDKPSNEHNSHSNSVQVSTFTVWRHQLWKSFLGRIAVLRTEMRPIVTDRVAWSVCRSVTLVSPAKMAALIELPFGLRTWVGPRNHVLDGGPDPPMGRGKFWGRNGLPL